METGPLSRSWAINRSKKRGASYTSREGSFMMGTEVPQRAVNCVLLAFK